MIINMLYFIKKSIKRYESNLNYEKYWKKRLSVQLGGTGVKFYYNIIWLRRQESKFCSATGIGLGTKESPTAWFDSRIYFPHGLANIIIARNVKIGKNVTIYQNVTIAEEDKYKITVIEDNVIIGSGAVILKNIHIGKGAKIGANAVVCENVPAGATYVGIPAHRVK